MHDPLLGPFIIVARNGRFVTCLGPGMRASNLPVVTRGELDTIATKLNTLRDHIKRARAATPRRLLLIADVFLMLKYIRLGPTDGPQLVGDYVHRLAAAE